MIASEFDKEILKPVPKSIAEAFRHFGGMLTGEDVKATFDFINELVNKNLQKYKFSGQKSKTSAK